MARVCSTELVLWPLLGCLAVLLTSTPSHADGRVFLLEFQNGSEAGLEVGPVVAEEACAAQGARLASGVELRHAVVECAFSACTRGWLAGPSIGTTVCSSVGGARLRAVDVQVENVTEDGGRLDVFCVKDSGAPCGDPPSFPHTRLQGQTGLELGDELLYSCNHGYALSTGGSAFSLLCDSCGEWYGLVQLCMRGFSPLHGGGVATLAFFGENLCINNKEIKDDAEAHIDYEDKFPDDHHLYDNLEEMEQEEGEEHGEGEGDVEAEEHGEEHWEGEEQEEQQEASFPPEGGEVEGHEQQEERSNVEEERSDAEEERSNVEEERSDVEEERSDVGEERSNVEEERSDVEEERSDVGEESTAEEGGEEEVQEEVQGEGEGKEEEDSSVLVTKAPVSLLSQKHLFWFPSEAFQEAEHPYVTDIPPKGPTHQHNHITAKESDSQSETETHGDDHALDLPTAEPVNHSVSSTEESWLDGYPVTQEEREEERGMIEEEEENGEERGLEEEEEEERGERGMEEEEEERVGGGSTDAEPEEAGPEQEMESEGMTDSPNDVEMSSAPSTSQTQISADNTPTAYTQSHTPASPEEWPMGYTPSPTPENVSTIQEGAWPELVTTPSGMEPSETTPTLDIITSTATPTNTDSWETTEDTHTLTHTDTHHFLDQMPRPTEHDDVTALPHDSSSSAEGGVKDLHNLTDQSGGATDRGGACGGEACPSAGRGTVVAAVIVGVAAVLVGGALGVWCYRKRQRKSSHYQLNGTHTHTQCIELQQTA